eukprot:4523-Heterococcus_DN1.PRE.3
MRAGTPSTWNLNARSTSTRMYAHHGSTFRCTTCPFNTHDTAKTVTRQWRLEGAAPAPGELLPVPPAIVVRVGDSVDFVWAPNYTPPGDPVAGISSHNVVQLFKKDDGECATHDAQ